MYRAASTVLLIGTLVLPLGACSSPLGGGGDFDPTDLIPSDWFNTKKKLPGERKPVFPEGVPGTTTGVPPELVKGYQPAQPESLQDQPPAVPGSAGLPRAEPKPRAVSKAAPKAKPKPATRTAVTVGPPQTSAPVARTGGDAPWPDAPAPPQAQPSGGSPFPDPPNTRAAPAAGSPAAGVQTRWPDPPPAR